MTLEISMNLFGLIVLLLACYGGYMIGMYRERLEWKDYEWDDGDEDAEDITLDTDAPTIESQVIGVLAQPSPPPSIGECGRNLNGPIFCNLPTGHEGVHARIRPAGTVIQ